MLQIVTVRINLAQSHQTTSTPRTEPCHRQWGGERGSKQDIDQKETTFEFPTRRCCRTWNSGCGRYLLCNACQLASRVVHCIAKGGTSPISQRQTLHHLNIGQKHSNILTTFPVKLDYAPSLAQQNWTAKLPLGAWMSTHFLAPSAGFSTKSGKLNSGVFRRLGLLLTAESMNLRAFACTALRCAKKHHLDSTPSNPPMSHSDVGNSVPIAPFAWSRAAKLEGLQYFTVACVS